MRIQITALLAVAALALAACVGDEETPAAAAADLQYQSSCAFDLYGAP